MGEGNAMEYNKFKENVLKRFKMTPESYRLKYRDLKMFDNITHAEYVCKTCNYMRKWIVGVGTEGSYNKLFDLMAQEQLLWSISD